MTEHNFDPHDEHLMDRHDDEGAHLSHGERVRVLKRRFYRAAKRLVEELATGRSPNQAIAHALEAYSAWQREIE